MAMCKTAQYTTGLTPLSSCMLLGLRPAVAFFWCFSKVRVGTLSMPAGCFFAPVNPSKGSQGQALQVPWLDTYRCPLASQCIACNVSLPAWGAGQGSPGQQDAAWQRAQPSIHRCRRQLSLRTGVSGSEIRVGGLGCVPCLQGLQGRHVRPFPGHSWPGRRRRASGI